MRPAECIKGLNLADGWIVIDQISPPPHATGGHFSIGYLVEHKTGTRGYLKALDFSGAFQSSDPSRTLQAMTEA